MGAVVLTPLPAAGYGTRAVAWLRQRFSRRLALRLLGIPYVVLEGRVYPVRAVPFGVARELVPALLRCSRRFAAWQIDEALYADMVLVLSRGLGTTPAVIDRLTVPLWELGPVVEAIARANGLPQMEAGEANLGKFLEALTKSTGTNSAPSSSAPPAGPGSMSTNA